MDLLLDTHILVDLIRNRLSEELSSALASPELNLHTSVASLWEIAIKVRLGQLPLSVEPEELPELVENMALSLLPIKAAHVVAIVEPAPATRDPFDRLLLAQCQVEGMQLVTLDRALSTHRLVWRSS